MGCNWLQPQSMTSHAGTHVHYGGDDAKTAAKDTGCRRFEMLCRR